MRQLKFEKVQKDITTPASVLKFSLLSDVPEGSTTVIYKYIALRVLHIRVEVDSATLQLLNTDLIQGLHITSHEEALATSVPDQYMNNLSLKLMSTAFRRHVVDIYSAKN